MRRGKAFTRYLPAVAFLVLCACSSKPQGGQENAPLPVPETPQQQSTAVYVIRPDDATRDTIFFSITPNIEPTARVVWTLNGQPAKGQTGPQFKPGELRKGDVVQAKIIKGDIARLSSPVTIRNSPPVISSAAITPAVPKTYDLLTAEAIAADKDNDKVTFRYEWYRNDRPAGDKESLEGPFKAGDRIMLKLTPFDGEEYGPTMVLLAAIHNSPPVVTNKEKGRVQGTIYTYRITASDPDGDALTYRLKKAPAGMTIEESSGLITWRFTAKDTGKHAVSVLISDGKGGDVLYDFDVEVGIEK